MGSSDWTDGMVWFPEANASPSRIPTGALASERLEEIAGLTAEVYAGRIHVRFDEETAWLAILDLRRELDRLRAAEAEVAQWREIGEKVSAIAETGFYKDSEDHLVLYYEDFDSVVEQVRALLASNGGGGDGRE